MADSNGLVGGFNQQQLELIRQGTGLYTLAAQQELGGLLAGLGLPDESIGQAVIAAGKCLESSSMLDVKDVAERLQFVRHMIVGQATAALTLDCSVTETAQIPSDSTAMFDITVSAGAEATAQQAPLTEIDDSNGNGDDGNIDSPAETAHSPESVESVEYIDPKTAERLAIIYGFKYTGSNRLQMLPPHFFKVEKAKIADAIVALVDFQIKNRRMWSTRRDEYIELLQRRIIEGVEYKKFGSRSHAITDMVSRSSIYMSNIPEDKRLELLSPFISGELIDIRTMPVTQHNSPGRSETSVALDTSRAREMVARLYGGYMPELPNEVNIGTYSKLLDAIFELVQAHADKRLVKYIGTYRQLINTFINSDLSLIGISKELGKSDTYAYQMLKTFTKTAQSLLAEFGTPKIDFDSQTFSEEPEQAEAVSESSYNVNGPAETATDAATDSNDGNHVPSETTVEAAEPTEILAGDDGITRLRKLFNLDEADEQVFRDMFNPERSQPIRSETATTIYADLKVTLNAVEDSKMHPRFVKSLEYRALRLLANGAKNGDPLAPKTVQTLLSCELKDTRQKISDVFSNAFSELARIRLEMLQQK